MDITDFRMQRIEQMLILLKKNIVRETVPLEQWRFCECGYKKDNVIPDKNGPEFRDFQPNERWGTTLDSHAWFCTHVVVPEHWRGKDVRFSVITGKETGWDARNPQFIAYIDGKLTQGLDVNHTELYLEGLEEFDLDLYAYAGLEGTFSEFIAELRLVNSDCEKLYYDLRVPYESLLLEDPISKSYADILRILNKTVNHKWSDRRVNDEHTKWTFEIMRMKSPYCSDELVWKDVEVKLPDNITLINSEKECCAEGILMWHCLYTNYWGLIRVKKYVAFHVTDPDEGDYTSADKTYDYIDTFGHGCVALVSGFMSLGGPIGIVAGFANSFIG